MLSDAQSVAAARVLAERLGRTCGGSTGTCMWVAAKLISEMVVRGETGSVVTLLCDSGERYRSTLFNDAWLASRNIDLTAQIADITMFFAQGHLN